MQSLSVHTPQAEEHLNLPDDSPVVEEYSYFLERYNLEFSVSGYYLMVGETSLRKRWVLDISVIRSQLNALFCLLLPELQQERVGFKLIRNLELAKLVLDGNLGYLQLAKILCIYPVSDEQALRLAKSLICLTERFKGPVIPTDLHLGTVVYTRFEDPDSAISYLLRPEISWPFYDIKGPEIPKTPALFNKIYKPVNVLKPDVKGRVIKGMYMQGLFRVRTCLIKEGKSNMWADDESRDIQSRLVWQQELHNDLYDTVPLPKIIELFRENGNTYLVMEFIQGEQLDSIITAIYAGGSWWDIQLPGKIRLLGYLSRILSIVELLHAKGYIHRDLTPVNFLIDKNDGIFLIDLELAYSKILEKPLPPFKLGTPGFMSPEQIAILTPGIGEDIYGLGALMILFFTGLPPLKFDARDLNRLTEGLFFFTKSGLLAETLSACLHPDPIERPSLLQIKAVVKQYHVSMQNSLAATSAFKETIPGDDQWIALINASILGLAKPIMLSGDSLWGTPCLEKDDRIGNKQLSVSYQKGLFSGMAGVLFLLARAKNLGFDTSPCSNGVNQSVEFLCSGPQAISQLLPPGLYEGTAGMAVALCACQDSRLLQENTGYGSHIPEWLGTRPRGLDLATGVAGHGLAILQCRRWIKPDYSRQLLENDLDIILASQCGDGSWKDLGQGRSGNTITGLSHGMAGIICFLIGCAHHNTDNKLIRAIENALHWLTKRAQKQSGGYCWHTASRNKQTDPCGSYSGIPGIVLCLIKAYELTRAQAYKNLAEGALTLLPQHPVGIDFTQAHGLAGLGETYLEAARVFRNEEWQKRADWIAQIFRHTFLRIDGSAGYWAVNAGDLAIPSLMVGNGGIIYFLMRYFMPDKEHHVLLQY